MGLFLSVWKGRTAIISGASRSNRLFTWTGRVVSYGRSGGSRTLLYENQSQMPNRSRPTNTYNRQTSGPYLIFTVNFFVDF